jgi:hypothetical protein
VSKGNKKYEIFIEFAAVKIKGYCISHVIFRYAAFISVTTVIVFSSVP